MKRNGKKIVIIGGGIAGLSAAVYALKCGYEVEVLEMHDMAGGLAMSWRRGPYTFETCLHWLIGSKPDGEFNQVWKELVDLDKLTFVDPHEFVRIETEDGDTLRMYTNADMLEAELLRRAPQDIDAIHDFIHAIRTFGKFKLLDPAGGIAENWLNMLRDVPVMPLLMKLGKMSGKEYGARFADPLLRGFFATGDMGKLTALAMVLSLAWMNNHDAGYCIGGSQALIRLFEEKIAELGGTIRFNARVERVIVEEDRAIGVQLVGGEAIPADWVISAADGHATIYEMLGGRYVNDTIGKIYAESETFASYLQVSLGIARDLKEQPAMLTRVLGSPIVIDPGTELSSVGFRFFHFDPTSAPAGKTAVTSILPTRNYEYWEKLRSEDPQGYRAEKARVAEVVIDVLEGHLPGIRRSIEVMDVSTPATVIRYTGNWKGSQEGWIMPPGAGIKPYPNTLPGLDHFFLIGQWIMPGGGLPSGPMTARPAIKAICKRDRVAFEIEPEVHGQLTAAKG
ncbi:phytoene desaturase family protein [Occallatibacter savannae]|uniref:phytoene desaturase family protein n=1 Tax=Occallatibacter savannae TaxID=1002691 RepID=UPI000D6989C3|nr:NAD(P)/FAD-dependent oxidoreductase [Occallatibacter savannae]